MYVDTPSACTIAGENTLIQLKCTHASCAPRAAEKPGKREIVCKTHQQKGNLILDVTFVTFSMADSHTYTHVNHYTTALHVCTS